MPDQIYELPWNTFQVRVTRTKRPHSRCFPWSRYGGKRKALAAAKEYRDKLLAKLPATQKKGGFRTEPEKSKVTDLPAGVSRCVCYDKRRDRSYVRYGVNWTNEQGKRKTTSFQAGPVDELTTGDDAHARNTAIAFRKHWESCRAAQRPFNPAPYSLWKEGRLYPFKDDHG